MRRLGWILVSLGVVVALVAAVLRYTGVGDPPVIILIACAVTMVPGLLILTISWTIRLARGQVRLRLGDAARRAGMVFLIVFGTRSLIELIFPNAQGDLHVAALHSAGFSVVYGLYVTAYREPA
jgi:hypothetical protein